MPKYVKDPVTGKWVTPGSVSAADTEDGGGAAGSASAGATDVARKASRESLAFYRSGAVRKGSVGRKGSAHRKRSTSTGKSGGGTTVRSAASSSSRSFCGRSAPAPSPRTARTDT